MSDKNLYDEHDVKKDNEMEGQGQEDLGKTFTTTEMGSARFATLRGKDSRYHYEMGPTDLAHGTKGPPWSIEPSMHFVCDEVGIDYDQFISALKGQKGDFEMAREFAVPEKTIKLLKERFYKSDVPITGNYGQD